MHSLTLVNSLLVAALSAAPLATAGSDNGKPANMWVTLYHGEGCNTTAPQYTVQLLYGQNSMLNSTTNADNLWGYDYFSSYILSRTPTLKEQIDISGSTRGEGDLFGVPAQCTLFHETVNPDSNGNALQNNTCYGLLLGPASCISIHKD